MLFSAFTIFSSNFFLPITDADGRPELKGRAKWLKKAVTAKDPLEDAAKKEEKKRRTDKSDKKRCYRKFEGKHDHPSDEVNLKFLKF